MSVVTIEWWYATSVKHAEADETCGRKWVCACGACRSGREATKFSTAYELLRFGARKQIAYGKAMSG